MKTGDNVNAKNAGESDISFVVRECRVPGSTETEKRVVWSGTKIQIQPNFRQVHDFLDYLGTKWVDALRRNEVFVDEFGLGPKEVFPHLASKLPLRSESAKSSKTSMFADETIVQLVPLIRWCNANLKDYRIWSKFMNTQRQQRHWRTSGRQQGCSLLPRIMASR